MRTRLLVGTAALTLAATPSIAQDSPGAGESIQPIVTTTAEELFQHIILFEGLEELGYEVEDPLELGEYGSLHVALAGGDAHFTAVHWRILHESFYENAGGDEQLERLGVLVEDVLQGYLIDKETAEEYDITSLEQFQDPEIAALFDTDGDGAADLTGCNPGWGCEQVIEHQIPEYGLSDTVEHNQGSYFALISDTIGRYERGEPIFYYTWTPLWVSSVLEPGEDVEWLEVPYTSLPEGEAAEEDTTAEGKNLGFAVDNIMVLANKAWADENPAAAAFLEAAEVPLDAISDQNLSMEEGEDDREDIDRHAEEWIEANQDEFDSWVEAGRDAAD
ncbi:MAG: glycine betaine/L-proline ABC transporter substrate-binding protein ProX [Alphaproteobacteria bacterium]